MVSPFQQHQARLKKIGDITRLESARSAGKTTVANSLMAIKQKLALYESSLESDLKRLKDLTTEQKAELKSRELIPQYKPLVDEIISSGHPVQSPIVGWVLVWMMDCGQFDDALPLAKKLLAIGQELPLPRDIPTFMADAFKEWAAAEIEKDCSINPYIGDFLQLVETDPTWAIMNKSRADLYKLLGLQAYKNADWQAAIDYFTTAQSLNDKIGVKVKLAEAEKALAKQQAAATA